MLNKTILKIDPKDPEHPEGIYISYFLLLKNCSNKKSSLHQKIQK